MSALEKVINGWTYHMNGGYYTKEIPDGDVLKQAAAELEALRAERDEAVSKWRYVEGLNAVLVEQLEQVKK